MTTRQYLYRVESVEKITDGDTYWLHVDVGFRVHLLMHCRLFGFDTPEMNSKSDFERSEARLAQSYVRAWFAQHLIEHRVWVQTAKDPDSFGRWLGEIWYDEGIGQNGLGPELVGQKLATAWPVRWRDIYDSES